MRVAEELVREVFLPCEKCAAGHLLSRSFFANGRKRSFYSCVLCRATMRAAEHRTKKWAIIRDILDGKPATYRSYENGEPILVNRPAGSPIARPQKQHSKPDAQTTSEFLDELQRMVEARRLLRTVGADWPLTHQGSTEEPHAAPQPSRLSDA